ncbi:hypothetical protein B484DRAFT_452137 [Ochromonadaceae sp. CCMP2298]|nr:hypothetical protein B484DRAFT_452137 [Ochromonadaceae sp. CCMP2298]
MRAGMRAAWAWMWAGMWAVWVGRWAGMRAGMKAGMRVNRFSNRILSRRQPQHRICRRGLHTPRYYHVIFAVAVHVSCAADGHAEVVILRGSPNDEEAAGNEARQYHGREPARLFKDDV